MMETKDLKLGDWVYYTSPVDGEKEACRIANTGEAFVSCLGKPLSFRREISPIPLTRENLGQEQRQLAEPHQPIAKLRRRLWHGRLDCRHRQSLLDY